MSLYAGRQAVSRIYALHEDAVQAVLGSHQSRDADCRFMAKHADLDLETVLESGRDGPDPFLHEEHVADRLSRLLQVVPDFKLHRTELKTLDDRGIQVLKDRVTKGLNFA